MILLSSLQHRFSQLTSTKTKSVSSCSNVDGLYKYDLPAILKERVVGTPSHAEVRDVSYQFPISSEGILCT